MQVGEGTDVETYRLLINFLHQKFFFQLTSCPGLILLILILYSVNIFACK